MDTAVNLCVQYLDSGWQTAHPSDVSCVKVMGGKSNQLFHCKLNEGIETEHKEVMVRIYGSEFMPAGNPYKLLGESEEAIIFHIINNRFSGPALLALFPGGRIEQFLDVETVTVDEYESTELSLFIAKFVATIQSLDFPISKLPQKLSTNVHNLYLKYKLNMNESKYSGYIYLQYFTTFDFEAEIKWIETIVAKITTKVVFVHVDLNRTNIVKRRDTNNYLVMDYEYCRYSYRWIDLSVYFCEAFFNHFEYNKQIDFTYFPDEKQRLLVIDCYLKELNCLSPKFDPLVDNDESLLFETHFGSMFVVFERLLFLLSHPSFNDSEIENWVCFTSITSYT